MSLPTIPPRVLLGIRIASFTFGVLSIALSAASVQITHTIPRPATGENILIIVASACGLITTAYRITAHGLLNESQRKRRFIPIVTESIVIAILLSAFIYGAVATSTGRGACEAGGDDDDDGGAVFFAGGRACALTKASTAFTFVNFATLVASTYTVGTAIWDERAQRGRR